jgi:hypothetical protein
MLDVHAPHQSPFGVRDFFVHLLTITVGLLIALGLEAAVEAMHHRHQRIEAEALIRQEIRQNAESLEKAATQGNYSILKERDNLAHFITMTRGVLNGEQPPAGQKIDLGFHEEEIPDSAWRTATNTGVLEYMPYDEVERFGDAYREQALLQSMAQKTLEDYLELSASIDATRVNQGKNPFVTKDDAVRAMEIAQRAYGHLAGIIAAGQGTMDSYKKALE